MKLKLFLLSVIFVFTSFFAACSNDNNVKNVDNEPCFLTREFDT